MVAPAVVTGPLYAIKKGQPNDSVYIDYSSLIVGYLTGGTAAILTFAEITEGTMRPTQPGEINVYKATYISVVKFYMAHELRYFAQCGNCPESTYQEVELSNLEIFCPGCATFTRPSKAWLDYLRQNSYV